MNNEQLEMSFGAVKSPSDYRDVPLAAVSPENYAASLPDFYIEDVNMLPVEYQRRIGACVGHAAMKYKQRLDYLETGTIIKLSPRFYYAVAKCRDGFPGEGTYPRLVAKIAATDGCATEATIPNDTTLDHETYVYNHSEANIPASAYTEAKQYAIKGYAFADVKKIDELKQAISTHHGAILLMRVGNEWWTKKDGSSSWSANDIIPLRAPKKIDSGHEVYLYGYENTPDGRVKMYVFNSWSVQWGLSGKAWFYYDEMVNYLDEAITFVDLPNNWQEHTQDLPADFKHAFNIRLQKGYRGPEVIALQTAYRVLGLWPANIPIVSTNIYGDTTTSVTLAFMRKYKVASELEMLAVGGKYIGPKTRAKLNELFNK